MDIQTIVLQGIVEPYNGLSIVLQYETVFLDMNERWSENETAPSVLECVWRNFFLRTMFSVHLSIAFRNKGDTETVIFFYC